MSPELVNRARAAARAYRLGMNGQAGEELARVLDGLLELVQRSPPLAARAGGLLAELGAAQQRGDWIALADGLEFELPRALQA